MGDGFPTLRFKGRLRPSQADVVAIARRKLAGDRRCLYIVAPPGSGKTILGLYLWAECVRRPALVLSPNSAIQAQWAAKAAMFDAEGGPNSLVSTEAARPALLTSLTYQAVTLPRRGGDGLDEQALEVWCDTLIEKGQAKDPAEAMAWVDDLREHNPAYFEERLAAYRKEVRDAMAIGGDALRTLHPSALANLQRLRGRGIGLLILDECHHLMGHWGRVLAEAHELLGRPVILGLTATPPDEEGRLPQDVRRYNDFFGPVDYDVPVPAVVKDGFLAPYQDLAYFVRPAPDELAYIARADEEFRALVRDLSSSEPPAGSETRGRLAPSEPLAAWLQRVLAERELPMAKMKTWETFEQRDPQFAEAARLFLMSRKLPLPPDVPKPPLPPSLSGRGQGRVEPSPSPQPSPWKVEGSASELAILVPVLDRYIRHCLRRSPHAADQELAERAIARLRLLGVQITETGTQPCASPVGRVMAYSRSKLEALVPILKAEIAALGDGLRAVVIADYEKASATSGDVGNPLDDEAGGAVAAFRALLADPATDALDPVLVTGSTVLVDDDVAPRFTAAAKKWLRAKGIGVMLRLHDEAGFHALDGEGADWCPRVYVMMVTDLFQRGVTRCLVGTRGLLGEGWDAERVNVLVDLTTATTSMTVRQVRGRSIRLDPADPAKLANNWDVVCVAPEFTKGLDDYGRFIGKHRWVFGLTDDGAVEKGVGHVHPAFTELEPEGIEGSMAVLNADMLARAARRAEFRARWRIGEPYHPEPVHTLEAKPIPEGCHGGFPPFGRPREPWSGTSLSLAVGEAVLGALRAAKLLGSRSTLQVAERAGGYVRLFLKGATAEESALFTRAVAEALGPLDNPRYVVPRYVELRQSTWLSRVLPEIVGRYFQRRQRVFAMLHAVPAALARHKDLVAIYQGWWNRYVSPGEAVYAHRGGGEKLVEQMLAEGRVPQGALHEKEVFL